jgi:hypothetical protein
LDIGADHDDVGRGLVRDEKPRGAAAGKCKLMPITIIGHGLTWHFRKTVLNRAKSNHPTPARLSRSRKSVFFIIVISAGLPEELSTEKTKRV